MFSLQFFFKYTHFDTAKKLILMQKSFHWKTWFVLWNWCISIKQFYFATGLNDLCLIKSCNMGKNYVLSLSNQYFSCVWIYIIITRLFFLFVWFFKILLSIPSAKSSATLQADPDARWPAARQSRRNWDLSRLDSFDWTKIEIKKQTTQTQESHSAGAKMQTM